MLAPTKASRRPAPQVRKARRGRAANGRADHPNALEAEDLAGFVWRMSVEQYHQMIEAGILTDDDPVELLEGWLIEKMPKGVRHTDATYGLHRFFEKQFAEDWYVNVQEPITLPESEPEPDIYVARGNHRLFRCRHPQAKDLVLVVEVAEATLKRDRNQKQRIYAGANIPSYWIVNLVDNVIEVYSEPTANAAKPAYQQRQVYTMSESAPIIVAGDVVGEVKVADVIAVEE
jgi:hypothetical protein